MYQTLHIFKLTVNLHQDQTLQRQTQLAHFSTVVAGSHAGRNPYRAQSH